MGKYKREMDSKEQQLREIGLNWRARVSPLYTSRM